MMVEFDLCLEPANLLQEENADFPWECCREQLVLTDRSVKKYHESPDRS